MSACSLASCLSFPFLSFSLKNNKRIQVVQSANQRHKSITLFLLYVRVRVRGVSFRLTTTFWLSFLSSFLPLRPYTINSFHQINPAFWTEPDWTDCRSLGNIFLGRSEDQIAYRVDEVEWSRKKKEEGKVVGCFFVTWREDWGLFIDLTFFYVTLRFTLLPFRSVALLYFILVKGYQLREGHYSLFLLASWFRLFFFFFFFFSFLHTETTNPRRRRKNQRISS